jgi:capsular polysaccharide biosynthesis protein
MARNTKYDWPNDQELQALLEEHGTLETARRIGCPPSSLSNRIRRRGLRGSNEPGTPTEANGPPEAANANGKPAVANGNGNPKAEGSGNPGTPNPDDSDRERKPTRRRPMREPVEHLGNADYLVRAKPRNGNGRDEKANDRPSPSERRRFRPRPPRLGSVRRPFALLRRIPPTAWRLLAVLALTAVAGAAAFISVRNDPKTYQRESSFAVRPSSTVPPAAVNDVIGTLAQPDSAITETIVSMLGSPRLSSFAAQSAGVPASSVGGSGAPYVWSATRRPGSTIIDMRITGPADDKLLAMQTAAAPEAARLVEQSYTPYRLETLSAASPPVQVGPKIARTVGFGLLLGALLGITLVLVERRLRSSVAQREGPSRPAARRGDSWEH